MDHQHELLHYGITDNENAYMPLTTVFAALVQCCIVWGCFMDSHHVLSRAENKTLHNNKK